MTGKILGVLLAVTLLPACAGSPEGTPESVTGPITVVEGQGHVVETFTVTTKDGDDFEVRIDDDIDYGFDLAHLHDHHESGDPVEVGLEERDGVLYALSIKDA